MNKRVCLVMTSQMDINYTGIVMTYHELSSLYVKEQTTPP